MEPPKEASCQRCGKAYRTVYAFCPECGELFPSVVSRGNLAVVLREVPAEKLREHLVAQLKSWFPDINSLEADRLIKHGKAVLLSGIDEESGRRIVSALKRMHVVALLEREGYWITSLWNGGLIVSAIAGLLAMGAGWMGGILLAVTAMAAPVIGAMLKLRRLIPLTTPTVALEVSEGSSEIAKEYTEVKAALGRERDQLLKALAQSVLELQSRLTRPSLVAKAAGEHRGRLYHSLDDALRTGIEMGRRILTEKADNQEPLKQEMTSLIELVTKTGEWYRRLEVEGIRQSPELAEEFEEITGSIDRIVEEVRSPAAGSRLMERL